MVSAKTNRKKDASDQKGAGSSAQIVEKTRKKRGAAKTGSVSEVKKNRKPSHPLLVKPLKQ